MASTAGSVSRSRAISAAVAGADAVDPDGERGGAVGVELALLWGVMLTLVLAVVQIGLVFYAGQLALTAAQTGVNAARTPTVAADNNASGTGAWSIAESAEDARDNADAFLADAAGTVLTDTTITTQIDQGAATVQVTVTGEVLSLIPGVTPTVSRDAVGGLEQVTP